MVVGLVVLVGTGRAGGSGLGDASVQGQQGLLGRGPVRCGITTAVKIKCQVLMGALGNLF